MFDQRTPVDASPIVVDAPRVNMAGLCLYCELRGCTSARCIELHAAYAWVVCPDCHGTTWRDGEGLERCCSLGIMQVEASAVRVRTALYNARDARGETQEQVAEAINRLAKLRGLNTAVAGNLVSRWECGRVRPSRLNSQLLAEHFGTTVAALGLARPRAAARPARRFEAPWSAHTAQSTSTSDGADTPVSVPPALLSVPLPRCLGCGHRTATVHEDCISDINQGSWVPCGWCQGLRIDGDGFECQECCGAGFIPMTGHDTLAERAGDLAPWREPTDTRHQAQV